MSEQDLVTRRLRVHGIVQGVGFRPTVDRHAATARVAGTVCNKGPYVEIFAQGTSAQVDAFERLLREQPPARAEIVRIESADVPSEEAPHYEGFAIIESEKTTGEIYVSPDIAICDDCKRELFDPGNRRYLHPFINCTCCGPRLTILDSLPYDRERTSMKDFPMCPECDREYHDPASRRYDAQPVCCNDCGPQVCLLGRSERGADAITATRRRIADGGIVAIKGIGGFHLACDATNEKAVELLRSRKHRPRKAFAVMARDEEVARRECALDEARMKVLTGHQKPIVLAPRQRGGRLCEAVAPGNPNIGIMLPYAPIQLLLFSYPDDVAMPDVLVMTSANVSGAPICHTDEEIAGQLSGVCDLVLSNDRAIRTRADDSVMDFFQGAPYMVRRSRGYAPLPVALTASFEHDAHAGSGRAYEEQAAIETPGSGPAPAVKVLAVGGELKNAFCLSNGSLFYPSAYVGDLADLRTIEALKAAIARMETLLEIEPEAIACDLHPRYNSRAVAEELAREAGVPMVEVQHHYAHIASCMAENDRQDAVIGLSFDGTGYGEDGTIWGGELLLCDWHGFRRLGHVAPFVQVGGDASALEGWRVAVSLIYGETRDLERTIDLAGRLGLADGQLARAQAFAYDHRIKAVTSTSAGRLFDAASAALGICRASTFEGEASMDLQFAAERYARKQGLQDPAAADASGSAYPQTGTLPAEIERLLDFEPVSRDEAGQLVMRTGRLFSALVRARLAGAPQDLLAYAFHAGLARMAVAAAEEACRQEHIGCCALSGGCFQNVLLAGLVKRQLEADGIEVLVHHLVPPNDGGIALGQAVVAAQAVLDGRCRT